jgi:hypothetical protein
VIDDGRRKSDPPGTTHGQQGIMKLVCLADPNAQQPQACPFAGIIGNKKLGRP